MRKLIRIALPALVVIVSACLPALLFAAAGLEQHDMSKHGPDAPSPVVAQVRAATEQYRDIQRALDAGYVQFLGCVSGPQEGAMGVHFVNPALVNDGVLDLDRPELLIYEFKKGVARLVGMEYVMPAAAWDKDHKGAPVLGGQLMHYAGSPNRYGLDPFYELHIWAWRDNPNGTFVDWNTRVSCDETP